MSKNTLYENLREVIGKENEKNASIYLFIHLFIYFCHFFLLQCGTWFHSESELKKAFINSIKITSLQTKKKKNGQMKQNNILEKEKFLFMGEFFYANFYWLR